MGWPPKMCDAVYQASGRLYWFLTNNLKWSYTSLSFQTVHQFLHSSTVSVAAKINADSNKKELVRASAKLCFQ